MSTAVRFTYHDYLQLPEDRRYEIVDGDLYMVPAPVPYHQRIIRNLLYSLHQYVAGHDLGEVLQAPCDLLLSETDVVQPDIMFIAKPKLSIIQDTNVHGAPDLVIEILSPATAERDRGIKRKLYARVGITEYWLIDPSTKTAEVLTLRAGTYERCGLYSQHQSLVSPVLPGFSLSLSTIF